ncbi:hypothetical protein CR513_02164, partial [Mucuna pruriens]
MITTPLSNVLDDDSLEVVHEVRSLEPSLIEISYIILGTSYLLGIIETCSKYLITKYVTTQRLSKSLRSFVHTMSSCHVPIGVQEDLLYSNWSHAIQEEMRALEKNNTWRLIALSKGKKQ